MIMGLERTVRFPSGTVPDWERVVEKLNSMGDAPSLRMIDGQLAFPDEQPPVDWSELRIGLSAGMVTLRRQSDRVQCLIWGNAEEELLRCRERCAWAFATSGAGEVLDEQGTVIDLEQFHSQCRTD